MKPTNDMQWLAPTSAQDAAIYGSDASQAVPGSALSCCRFGRVVTFKQLTLICCTLLSACSVGPDYRRPQPPNAPTFSHAAHPEFSASSIELQWWQIFQDPQLNGLVEQSVQHNYQLKAAKANLKEARALYLQSGLNLLPSITTHANYTDQVRSSGALNNRSFVPRGLTLYNLGFDASWEVDFFGRSRRTMEASNDEVAAQVASVRDLNVSIIAEVARNYFELRGLQARRSIAEKNIANQTETLRITQAKLANGRGTEQDSSSALAQLQSSRAGIPALESAIHRSIHRLSVLTGQVPGTLTQSLSNPVHFPKLPDTIQISTPADLLRRRPDILVAERTLAASTARIGVTTADLFPRVAFTGSIALEATTFSGLGAAGSDSYMLGPRITWAAFDIGRVLARIQAANAHAEADLAFYQQTVLNALEETENALITYNRERYRQTLLASAAEASLKAQQLAKVRYDAGIIDFQSLLNADAKLLQDQDQLSQGETTVATTLTALYKALGGGWDTKLSMTD